METRIAIFSFYDKEGVVDDYVLYLLDELLTIVDRLIVTVNGYVDDDGLKKLYKRSKEIVLRENKGFDGGAYCDVLMDVIGEEILSGYDELILCNDTFYGPFVPLKAIWDKMDQKAGDFWGINFLNFELLPHMESYFMIFRKSILQSGILYKYFFNTVNMNSEDLQEIIATFEDGLTITLLDHGFKPIAYVRDNKLNLYECSYILLSEYDFPVVKKKCFDKKYNRQMECMRETLQYIQKNTNYDIRLIINSTKRLYDFSADSFRTRENIANIVKEYQCNTDLTMTELRKFISHKKNIYIYGLGFWGKRLFYLYLRGNDNFKGFVVSDNQEININFYMGYSVRKISDINKNSSLIIAMNKDNSEVVKSKIDEFEDVLVLWNN